MLLMIPLEDKVWTEIMRNLSYAPHRKVASLIAVLNDALGKAQESAIANAARDELLKKMSAAAGATPGSVDSRVMRLAQGLPMEEPPKNGAG